MDVMHQNIDQTSRLKMSQFSSEFLVVINMIEWLVSLLQHMVYNDIDSPNGKSQRNFSWKNNVLMFCLLAPLKSCRLLIPLIRTLHEDVVQHMSFFHN